MVTGQTGIQPLLSHANVPARGKSQLTGVSPGRVWGRGQNGGVRLAGALPPSPPAVYVGNDVARKNPITHSQGERSPASKPMPPEAPACHDQSCQVCEEGAVEALPLLSGLQ
jgi:hypothetical protein